MTAATLFSLVNIAAMLGWLVLIYAVIRQNSFLRDQIAGLGWPLGLSALYLVLIVLFFGQSPGGFDTLENVQKLFTAPWAALAGWVHYLAFDLFMGACISRNIMEQRGSRLWLIALLPLTFLFGPIGFLAAQIILFLHRPANMPA